MPIPRPNRHLSYGLVVGIFFLLDRLLKYLAPKIPPAGHVLFGWDYFENTGIAFSIALPLPIIIFLTPIILVILLYTLSNTTHPRAWLGFWCILAGALSNVIDRVYFGYVIDYFRIGTGVINLADVLIIVGVVMLFYSSREMTRDT